MGRALLQGIFVTQGSSRVSYVSCIVTAPPVKPFLSAEHVTFSLTFTHTGCAWGLPHVRVDFLFLLSFSSSVRPCGMGELNDHVPFVMEKILQPIDLVNPNQAHPYRLHCSQLELRHGRVQLFL